MQRGIQYLRPPRTPTGGRNNVGWSIGYDQNWDRDVGYGVPAWCDHPNCTAKIDRGLSYVCGGDPYGGSHGCGLYFCEKHMGWMNTDTEDEDEGCQACERCEKGKEPFDPKPEHPEWVQHVLTDDSWHQWRGHHPKKVAAYKAALAAACVGDADREGR
jgi:hypothetical protein